MKKKIIFCLLSLSLMIAGCQSNEIEDITPPSKEVQLSPEELLSIRYKSSPELSQTEVFNLYNPQNEMFRLLGTKRSFSQNETFFFSHPYPALFHLISHF